MSRIEQLINEIEEYIDSCKFQPLSTTKIIVNKEELDELLVELRLRIPDEIKQYQKIISNQDAILSDAHSKADAMLAEATAQTNELVNEHEIMQRAYAQANEIIEQAQAQAQAIVDKAVADANNVRQGSIQYTDDMLKPSDNYEPHNGRRPGSFRCVHELHEVQLRYRFLQQKGTFLRNHHRERGRRYAGDRG